MVKKSFAVIGLGQFGRAVVEELVANSADVIAIDNDEEIVKKSCCSIANCEMIFNRFPRLFAEKVPSRQQAVIRTVLLQWSSRPEGFK